MENNNTPAVGTAGVLINPGDNLLSRWKHYHGPRMLNGRVRNGNGCGHPGVLTGKSLALLVDVTLRATESITRSVMVTLALGISNGNGKSRLQGPWTAGPVIRAGPRINAVKRLAVSTGQLRPLRALHTRPIYLVVFQEPSFLTEQET